MELTLVFNETAYRTICKEMLDRAHVKPFETWKNARRPHAILLGASAIVCALLTFLHYDWIYLAGCLGIATLAYEGWTRHKRNKFNLRLKEVHAENEQYIAKLNAVGIARYLYDDHKVTYFENDVMLHTFSWKNIIAIQEEATYFHLWFGHGNEDVCLIPAAMTDAEAYKHFKDMALSKIKALTKRTPVV
jgi:hypothetical protein